MNTAINELQQMKEKYLLNVKAIFSNGTYECYSCHLNYVFEWLKKEGIYEVKEITPTLITTFIICEKNKNVSNSTINKRVGVIKRMFRFSNIDNLEKVTKLKEKKVTFKSLDNDQLSKMLNYLDNSKIAEKSKLIILLLLDTGCRLSELLKIKKSNIDFDNNCILLQETKMDIERYVRFTNKTKKLLLKEIKSNRKSNYLFDIQHSSVESLFARLKKQLGFQWFSPHMLRHTHATILAKNGASLFMIQDDLGHTNPKTTERYVHLTFEDNTRIYNNCMLY